MTIKQRFEKFTTNIRPTEDHLAEARRQVDYMVDKLKNKVSQDKSFTLEKILRAGSNAKHTSLLATADNRFDVDLGAYYSGEDAKTSELNSLLRFTRDQVASIYPQKNDSDFEVLKSAVRVKFTSGIKLWVDIAPIVKNDSLGITNGGHIPRDDGWRLTSVTAHNDFVSTRTAESNSVPGPVKFNRLVRVIKWWNNRLGDLVQPAILCELVTAAAVADDAVTSEWQTSLRQVFQFMRKHAFESPIAFDDNYDTSSLSYPNDAVVILDSVNPDNNVAAPWTTATRNRYLDRVEDAYDASTAAWSAERDGDEDEAVDHWCEIFGDQFRTLSEKE